MSRPIAFAALAVALLAALGFGVLRWGRGDEKIVECRFAEHDRMRFGLDDGRRIVRALDRGSENEVNAYSDTEIRLRFARPLLSRYEHDRADLDLDRIAGMGRLVLSRAPTTHERESCEAEQGWGCDAPYVVTEEEGACREVRAAF